MIEKEYNHHESFKVCPRSLHNKLTRRKEGEDLQRLPSKV